MQSKTLRSFRVGAAAIGAFRALTLEAAATMEANQQATMAYARQPYMRDPGLRERLAQVRVAALVLWGARDRIVNLESGRRFAAGIPGAPLRSCYQSWALSTNRKSRTRCCNSSVASRAHIRIPRHRSNYRVKETPSSGEEEPSSRTVSIARAYRLGEQPIPF
jgi:hypothetical protein